mgnify:CR=1 FL=1
MSYDKEHLMLESEFLNQKNRNKNKNKNNKRWSQFKEVCLVTHCFHQYQRQLFKLLNLLLKVRNLSRAKCFHHYEYNLIIKPNLLKVKLKNPLRILHHNNKMMRKKRSKIKRNHKWENQLKEITKKLAQIITKIKNKIS